MTIILKKLICIFVRLFKFNPKGTLNENAIQISSIKNSLNANPLIGATYCGI
jgi:hypothetical protein